MRQRVTQLEAMLRSFLEPGGVAVSPRNQSETPSNQGMGEAFKLSAVLDYTKTSPDDTHMNDGDITLDESNPSPGQLTLENTQTSYVGNAHWGAVLNEVSMIAPHIGN